MGNDRHAKKAYSLRLDETIMSTLREIAEEEHRTLNKQIEYALSIYISDRAVSKKEEE